MLAQYWANGANAAQQGRIANPFFSIERSRFVDELEIARTISVGLLDADVTAPECDCSKQNRGRAMAIQ